MKLVSEFLQRFGIANYDAPLTRVDNAFFVVPDSLSSFIKYRPSYIGLLVGFVRNENFVPSVGLLQWMAARSGQKVVLDPDLEWKFICGNNIQRSLVDVGHDWVLVINRHGECIGIAQESEKYLKRVFDIGDLLRRERSRKLG